MYNINVRINFFLIKQYLGNNLMKFISLIFTSIIYLLGVNVVNAETRITYKSAKSTSSYYQMAIQIADTIKKSTNGGMILTIEESQGSVQNVKEVAGLSLIHI